MPRTLHCIPSRQSAPFACVLGVEEWFPIPRTSRGATELSHSRLRSSHTPSRDQNLLCRTRISSACGHTDAPHRSNSDLNMTNELQDDQMGGTLLCWRRKGHRRATIRQVQKRSFHPTRATSVKHNGAAFARRGINDHGREISPTNARGSALTRNGRRSAGRACREHVENSPRRGAP